MALAFALAVVACSKTGRDYGKLECLDGWPPQPTGVVSASLAVTPSIVWTTNLGLAAPPFDPGIAISNDHVIVSVGATWAALDRTSGKVLFGEATNPGNYFLSAPVVDSQGRIYVQSALTLYAYGADGVARWTHTLDALSSSEPEYGRFTPTLIGDGVVLLRSLRNDLALNSSGAETWKAPVGVPLFAVGHWGLGYDNTASFVTDLRTAKPAGRLLDGSGHDVVFLAPMGGRGILAATLVSSGIRFMLLDTCGKEISSVMLNGDNLYVVPRGGLVGPGEVVYVQVFHRTGTSNQIQPPEIVAIDPGGQIVAGPTSRVETLSVVGADGTVYAVELGSTKLTSRVVALSPALEEKWTVEVDGNFERSSASVLDADGILYVQVSTGKGNEVLAIQTTSPGLARSSWPALRHDNGATNWGGGQF